MKELSIKEKAKRYDKAIENGKQILNTPYTAHWDTMKEVVEHLLPELKESKDEMIRKELLEHCKNQAKPYIQTGNECPQIQSWIAWLEKQGEKDNLSIDFVLGYLGIKPAYKDGNAWCILLGDNIQEGICGFGDTKEEALIAFIKELIEKQGEKKPTIVDIMKNYFATTPKEQQDKDWEELKHLNDIGPDIEIAFGAKDSELVEASYYIPKGFHAEIDGDKVHIKKGEQKPVWSEDDEEMFKYAIGHFEIQKRNSIEGGLRKASMQEFIDWIKSLKDRLM